MNNRGKLIIIPNEGKIVQEAFERVVKKGESHTKYLQEFSDIYGLECHFEENDYQKAPCDMAKLGHMVLKIEEEVSLVVCYLPERITDRQYNYIYNHHDELLRYIQVNGYSLKTEEGVEWDKVHGIDKIMKEVVRKNLLPPVEKQRIR